MPAYYAPGTRNNNKTFIVRGRINGKEYEIRTTALGKTAAIAQWRMFEGKGGRKVNGRPVAPTRVYFIAVGDDAIKIGVARHVEARLASLQIGNHQELRLLGSIPGDEIVEKNIQCEFWPHHIRGEWFKAAPALLQFIDDATRSESRE